MEFFRKNIFPTFQLLANLYPNLTHTFLGKYI